MFYLFVWLLFYNEYLPCIMFHLPITGLSIGSRPESDSMGLRWDLDIVTLYYLCILKILMYQSIPQDCEFPVGKDSSLFHGKQLIGWLTKKRLSC